MKRDTSARGEDNVHLQRIITEGLAHYSYLMGDAGKAVVIDPRRDCDVYLDEARRAGLQIIYVLETHRHEDLVLGSVELASRAGAEVWHADAQLPYEYGQPLREGQDFQVGGLNLETIASPGHTEGGISYLLRDQAGFPWMLFSGDTLLAGDTGRTDLLGPDRLVQMRGLLHETLFRRLLVLGDDVLLWPAHGAGSVCGRAVADRPWTTIGLERRLNPSLSLTDLGAFLGAAGPQSDLPPYFSTTEKLNVQGAPALPEVSPTFIAPRAFADIADSAQVIDLRPELAYLPAHIQGSLFLGPGGISRYAGWFLDAAPPILLVTEEDKSASVGRVQLARMGFESITGCLAGGMDAWLMRGLPVAQTAGISIHSMCRDLESGHDPYILDVRAQSELDEQGRVPVARHVDLLRLLPRIAEIPLGRRIHVLCRSGYRSTVAASVLERTGRLDLAVILGGVSAWRSAECSVKLAWSTAGESQLEADE